MTYKTLDVSIDGQLAHVALNRPEKLNAMNGTMFREIGQAFRKLDQNASVRAIILSANGKHFTAGLDLKESCYADAYLSFKIVLQPLKNAARLLLQPFTAYASAQA